MTAKKPGPLLVAFCFFLAASVFALDPSPSSTYVGIKNAWAAKGGIKGPPVKSQKTKGPTVTVSGQVTNSLSGDPVGGANVTFVLDTLEYSTVTDASGMYSQKLPVDPNSPGSETYAATFTATDYNAYSQDVSVNKGDKATTVNATLEPVAPVIVNASISDDAAPGSTLNAMGSWKIMDGSSFVSAEWTQVEGAPAVIASPGSADTEVTLASRQEFKEELVQVLKEPPITAEQLPPNVKPPEDEFVGGLQDRYEVVGINNFALEHASDVSLKFEVVTSSGTYSAPVTVQVALDWRVNPGIRNVPIDVAVLLNGKAPGPWNWTLTAVPTGSTASLTDPSSQNPDFTPDLPGLYEVTESNSATALEIYAGTWRGVIVGQDADGRPVADGACTGCHNPSGFPAPDKFTPWAHTGHAEIFTNNLNTSDHYGTSCFGCHTVGYDVDAQNGGFDDASDYQAFLDSGLLHSTTGTEWTQMLASFPDSAQLANAQCENCHGPQDGSQAHTGNGPYPWTSNGSRVSLSAEVCGSCHGEPLRHARYQQWQLSLHSNYEVAVSEGDSGNCSRCHTVNGFLTWLPVLKGEVAGSPEDNVTVTWTADEIHPQTCVTCHDPHNAGTTSGDNTNAPVRIQGDTPMLLAGFQALGVGKGAICMTCHNSRRGLRNDSTWATTTDKDRAPHRGVQADLLMGQNAYFVTVGNRGAHSFITNTCVNCHMEKTEPPDLLAYQAGGTNHTFYASEDVCINCHTGGEPNAAGVQAAVGASLSALETMITNYYLGLINDLLAGGSQIDLDGAALITDPAQIQAIHLGESHGRQGLAFDLVSGTVGPVGLSAINVNGGAQPAGTTLLDVTADTTLKATWNYLLVHTDEGEGVHNPSFSSLVLENAICAVGGGC